MSKLPSRDIPLMGSLYFDANEAPTVAMVTLLDGQIKIEISYALGEASPIASWADDQASIPSEMIFLSADGRITLVRVEFRARRHNWGSTDHGLITLEAIAAVASGATGDTYSLINGARSEVAGLSEWANISTVERESEVDAESRIRAVTINARSVDPVIVGGHMGLSLFPSFNVTPDKANRRTLIDDKVLIQTREATLGTWDDHTDIHRGVQDLVALAFWWPCRADMMQVIRDDDPSRSIDGTDHGYVWRGAQVIRGRRPRVAGKDSLPPSLMPLFYLDHIGASGIKRWLDDPLEVSRAYRMLLSALYQQHLVVEAQLLQVGAALEVLGYRLAVKAKKIDPARKNNPQFSYPDALREIFSAMTCDVSAVLGSHKDEESWLKAFNAGYKGVKHADNALPSGLDAYELGRQGALLARLWLGQDLGAPADHLEFASRNA